MSVSFDVSGASNINPWVVPVGFTAVKSTAMVVSGSLRPTFNDGPLTLIRATPPSSSGTIEVVWTTAQDFNNPDGSGAAFVNSSGNGYFCKFFYDLVYVYAVTAGVAGSVLTNTSGLTYAAGAQFRATYNLDTNELKLYNQASPTTPIITYTAAPVTGLTAAIGLSWESTGGAGIVSATLSSFGATASIDSYPTTVRSGQTGIAYATTGLSSVSAITVGSLSATGISDTSGDGTHSLPTLTDGVAHQLYGTKTVTITGTGGSPTTATSFLPPTGSDYATLSGTLNTTTTGVLNSFSPAAVVGDQIVFETANGAVDAQGNYSGDYGGTQTMWHIKASDGVARSYSVITSTGATASPSGVSLSLVVGTVVAKGSAVASPSGVSLGLQNGTAQAKGSAVAQPLGVSLSLTVGQAIFAGISKSKDYLPKVINQMVKPFRKSIRRFFRKK